MVSASLPFAGHHVYTAAFQWFSNLASRQNPLESLFKAQPAGPHPPPQFLIQHIWKMAKNVCFSRDPGGCLCRCSQDRMSPPPYFSTVTSVGMLDILLGCQLLSNSAHVMSKPQWGPGAAQVSSLLRCSQLLLPFFCPRRGQKQGLRNEEVEGVPKDLVGSFLFASTPPEGNEGAQALTNSFPSQKEMLLSDPEKQRQGQGRTGCS